MCYLTDGRIKDTDLPLLLPDSAKLADELVTKGLWRRTRGGYVFKDWLEWGGKKTAREIRELRAQRAVAGRKGGLSSGNTRRSKRSKPQGGASGLLEPHTQPSPAIKTTTTAEVVNTEVEVTERAPPNGRFDYFGAGRHGLPPPSASEEAERKRQLDALAAMIRAEPEVDP